MKILLINPPMKAEERYGKDMAKFGPTNEPLGLAYIAAMCEKHGHDVQIWDGMVQKIKEIRFADIIGISILTPMYESAKQMIKSLRGFYPNTTIVAGGPHVTALPYATKNDLGLEVVFMGCAEYSFINYVNMISGGPEVKRSADLDDLPLPARHLLPMDRYQMTASRNQGNHAYTVIVARGCPFHCGYCSRIQGKKVQFHSVQRILREIQILIEEYDAKEINLEADTLTINRDFVIQLCKEMAARGYHHYIKWTCESRVDTVDLDMLHWMKAAGCWQISYGVETGTQRLLDLIQKGTKLDQIEKTFKMTKEVGINIRAFYMLGLPTETRKDSLKTIEFAKKLDADWSQFTLYTPFPGTALWDIANRERPASKNWTDYQTHAGWADRTPAWWPSGRSPDELMELQRQAYRSYYLRPSMMYKKLKSGLSLGTLAEGFKVLMRSRRTSHV